MARPRTIYDENGNRRCPACREHLPLDAFYKASGRPDGLSSRCKSCTAQKSKERRERDPDRVKSYRRKWMENPANRARHRANTRQWIVDNPEKAQKMARAGQLKTKYGLTLAEFDAMSEEQGGICAICKHPPTDRWKHLVVDHDHETGAVRGLLCANCNVLIGYAKDDPEILRAAAAYAERHVPSSSGSG